METSEANDIKDNDPPENDSSSNDGAKSETIIISETRKGKTILGASGEKIVFDSEGRATVNETDALYLKNCPGFKTA